MRRPVAPLVALVLLAAVPATLAAPGAPRPFTRVGRNVRVSSDRVLKGHDQQAEPYIAVDPLDPSRLVAAAQEGRFRGGAAVANGFYSSSDGGGHWRRGLVPGVSRASGGSFDRASDPLVAFDSSGTAFYSSLVLNFEGGFPTATAILVNRSTDGGRSWAAPATVAKRATGRLLDQPWLAVDAGAASPRRGTVYVAWTLYNFRVQPATSRVHVAHSDDGGLTWSRSVVASAPRDPYDSGVRLAVGTDGTVHLFYLKSKLRSSRDLIRVVNSSDGGTTWSKPRTVRGRTSPALRGVRTGAGLAAAVDASTGALHVVWTDRRPGGGDVLTSHSAAGGRHWSKPVRLTARRPGEVEFAPALAAMGGAVHVLFYDAGHERRLPHRYAVVYRESLDGGRSWRRRVRVNSKPFDIRRAVGSDRGHFLGDYIGIAATPGFAQAIWVDTRSASARRRGAANDVFTARITPR